MYIPPQNDQLPFRGNAFSRWLGIFILKRMGWTLKGELPSVPKCIAIGAPHTSNWDFVIGLAVMLATGLRGSWIAKESMFKWPFGGMWRWLGGIPVVRNKKLGAVEAQTQVVKNIDRIFMLIEPEGTRGRVEKWHTGFYRIAHGAGVPILPVSWDYPKKQLTFMPVFETTGEMEADIKALMQMYKDVTPKVPENSPWQHS